MLTIQSSNIRSISIRLIGLLVLLAAVGTLLIVFTHKSEAVDATQFNASRIMDDAVFYNASSMSAGQIQTFLNGKVPACDTNGSQMYNGSQTRAQYSATRGYNPPFTCLRDYTENTTAKTTDSYCAGYSAQNQTAAQIIDGVAKSCGINPQVLLVLLQKEQGLVLDDWPWSIQYRSATGMGCPDTAACDSQYYGLFNQLYYAARQFKLYRANPSSYSYVAGRNNTIQWNPSASCGSSTVFIENQATAGLYNYTPYRPNQAALNSGYGSGDSCSAYGNRNFWLYFTEWFGSTVSFKVPGCTQATNTSLSCVWQFTKTAGSQTIYTTSYDEANAIANSGTTIYNGIAFTARNAIAPQAGNIPIYSVTVGSADLLTANQNEYNTLTSQGNVGKGIVFYADPADSNSGYPVYRLYSATKGHAFTSDVSRRNQLLAQGYASEHVAFSALSPWRQETAAPVGKNLVYRFYIPGRQAHFFTADLSERDRLISEGYQYENVAWFGTTSSTTTPVYRLYSFVTQKHLYTTDNNERQNLVNTGHWRDEGTSFHVSAQSTATPVYRLYSTITKTHLLTTSEHEKNTVVNDKTFRYEGVGWYSP